MTQLRISEAAELLGVSDDTVRRWIDAGRLDVSLDAAGRRCVSGVQLAELMSSNRVDLPSRQSARNRFAGLVTRVERDGLMALVEIQSGPHRVVSLMTREAADELRLEPGMRASAVVKATTVVVDIG